MLFLVRTQSKGLEAEEATFAVWALSRLTISVFSKRSRNPVTSNMLRSGYLRTARPGSATGSR